MFNATLVDQTTQRLFPPLSQEHYLKKDFLFLLIFSLVLIVPGIGLRDPWPADEPRFALVAKQMVDQNQWLFPMRGEEYYPDKPPVFMWALAFFYWLIGSIRWSFLLPSFLAATANLWLVYDLGRRCWGRDAGLAAAGSLLVMFQFTLQARTAQIDMVLTFWTTLGLYGWFRTLFLNDRWYWFLTGSLAMGLGVITKGVGFLPLFLAVPYIAARIFQWEPLNRKAWPWLLSAPVFLIAGTLIWFLPMILQVAQSSNPDLLAYRDNILFKQTGDRYLRSWHHIKPFWYFLVSVIPWAWLPFSLIIFPYLKQWAACLRKRDSRVLGLILWAILTLLFFSLTKGKRGVYLLPISPAIALLLGMAQQTVFASGRIQAYFRWLGTLIGTLFPLIALGVLSGKLDPFEDSSFQLPSWLLWPMIPFGLALITIAQRMGRRSHQSHLGYLAVYGAMWAFIGLTLWPALNPVRSPARMMAELRETTGPEAVIGLVAWKEQILLQAQGPVKAFGFMKSPEEQMAEAFEWLHDVHATEPRYVLLNAEFGKGPFEPHEVVYEKTLHRRPWLLFKAKK